LWVLLFICFTFVFRCGFGYVTVAYELSECAEENTVQKERLELERKDQRHKEGKCQSRVLEDRRAEELVRGPPHSLDYISDFRIERIQRTEGPLTREC
jgi:hypothetical protein